jgi:hypothetical protein
MNVDVIFAANITSLFILVTPTRSRAAPKICQISELKIHNPPNLYVRYDLKNVGCKICKTGT